MLTHAFFFAVERWSKFGAFGYGPGELQYPCYVTTNKDGNIFVSDMHNSKIQVCYVMVFLIDFAT